MEKHRLGPDLEFNHIVDGIYIGTNQCCLTHFDGRLKAEGVSADLSLEEEHLDAPFGAEFFLWLPTKDLTAPTPSQFAVGISYIDKLLAQNCKVYVHCRLGHGRAPTMVAAYLIAKKGMTVDEAVAFIKERRPVIHLEDEQLESLQALVK